ncbi:MAG: LysR substrate-binding domain-containing protein [Fulvivirga sp.]|uniref:hydrogen peroxide-inducible genes activator n=1 Tax=Fulvivirga sp. TaxID=1931237 RepID=UPI0032EB184C
MTLQQLTYALQLQKYGNFGEAAHHLKISQPALSLQIGKLEKEIGLLIFDRSKSPVVATTEGRLFLDKASTIVHQANDLKEFAQNTGDSLTGKLKIGIIPTLAPFLVPLFAYSFQEKYPGISLDINEVITEKTVIGVRDGQLDAGILSTPIHASGVESHPLFYEKFYLYSSPNVPKRQRTLATIDYRKLWLLDEGNCFRDQVNDFCNVSKIRENKDFIYRSNSIDALIRIVDSKGGMTILPELTTLILNEEQEENISEINTGKTKAREVGLIKRPRTNKENMISVLMDHIVASIPKNMLNANKLEVVDPNIHMV